MKLRHLPKFAALSLAVVVVLATSATAYAAYVLWPKPSVEVSAPQENQYKRKEVIASFTDCGNKQAQTKYEVKKGATLSDEDVAKTIQAICERDAIEKWMVSEKMPNTPPIAQPEVGQERVTTMLSSVASNVVSIDAQSLSLNGDEWNSPKEPLVLTDQTKYIANSAYVDQSQIKPGDSVLYITKNVQRVNKVEHRSPTNTSFSMENVSRTVMYVIKMDLPFAFYGPDYINQLAVRELCQGNPDDTCINVPSVDIVYGKGRFDDKNQVTGKTIEGKLIETADDKIKIETSSGKLFTVEVTADDIAAFNHKQPQFAIEKGDYINVRYTEKSDQHSNVITKDKLQLASLILDGIGKANINSKY